MNFNGSSRPYDLFWLYRWMNALSREVPAMAVLIRNDLLNAIMRSECPGRIWLAEIDAAGLEGYQKRRSRLEGTGKK